MFKSITYLEKLLCMFRYCVKICQVQFLYGDNSVSSLKTRHVLDVQLISAQKRLSNLC